MLHCTEQLSTLGGFVVAFALLGVACGSQADMNAADGALTLGRAVCNLMVALGGANVSAVLLFRCAITRYLK